MPHELDFTIIKNNQAEIILSIKTKLGNPFALTGYTLKWCIANPANDGMALVTKTLDDGIRYIAAQEGQIAIDLNPSDTENIPSGTYIHELIIEDGSGAAVTVTNSNSTAGKIHLREQYTRPG